MPSSFDDHVIMNRSPKSLYPGYGYGFIAPSLDVLYPVMSVNLPMFEEGTKPIAPSINLCISEMLDRAKVNIKYNSTLPPDEIADVIDSTTNKTSAFRGEMSGNLIDIPKLNRFTESDYIRTTSPIGMTHTTLLLQTIKQDDFVPGEDTATEALIDKIASEYGWQETMTWLQEVLHDNIIDSDVAIGLMHSLGHFDYDNVKPQATFMAATVLSHFDFYVRIYAVRAFEQWNSRKSLPVLKTLHFDVNWQQKYIDKVILAIEERGIE